MSSDPIFLDVGLVLRIHESLIGAYGGTMGVRDIGLLQSAVAMPESTFGGQFLHADIFHMAAAYLFHIVQNHPFLDGNKRTGAAAAIIFLSMNDIRLQNDEDGLVEITLAVATGKADKEKIVEFLQSIIE